MAPPIQHAPPTSTHIGHNCASGCTTHRHSGGISTLLTFMVVLSGRFSVPPQQTKQALAISTECVYNARVFVVGHVWKHGRIYLFRKNMVRLGWGTMPSNRPGWACPRPKQTCDDVFGTTKCTFGTTKCDHASSWHRTSRIYSGKSPKRGELYHNICYNTAHEGKRLHSARHILRCL